MTLPIYSWSELSLNERSEILRRPAAKLDGSIRADTAAILEQVRSEGDAAVCALTARLDGASVENSRISNTEIDAAIAALDSEQVAAIDLAIRNVRTFHTAQLSKPIRVETMPGVVCERRSHAIDSVGLYVPAGTAPLPSAAVMLAVPAVLAECPRIIMCTPPRPDGSADPAVLTAATRAGVTEIYKIGGAQAIAAMAYGTESVPRVNKLFGPGNAWVTCAKSLVSGDPDGAAIDLPAGPSEVLVIADENASAEFVAADLLSQAEHGVDSQVILLSSDKQLAVDVQHEVQQQLSGLSRAEIATQALQHSRIVLVDAVATAVDISNQYAPEHLILQVVEAREVLSRCRNAGSVFVGPWTPESVGDYCSGTNHVLPTYGYASSFSGLGVDQFLRQMTVQEVSRDGLRQLSNAVITLATMEGLDAHAAAVSRRLGEGPA
ncbi:MAG: histidinol dehydrogenase [Gammaproteobacteria bacterium]|nr:histidinol dehydrogenase [Gammaproteobacteria bacterium]